MPLDIKSIHCSHADKVAELCTGLVSYDGWLAGVDCKGVPLVVHDASILITSGQVIDICLPGKVAFCACIVFDKKITTIAL